MVWVRYRRCHGFSLVEFMLVVAVLAILVGLALPNMADTVSRQRGRGLVEKIRSELVHARTEAIKTNSPVFVSVTPGNTWCFAVSRGAGCGCAAACSSQEDSVSEENAGAYPGALVASVSFAGSLCGALECVRFEPTQGTARGSNGTVVIQTTGGASYKVIVASTGRARVCVVNGDSSAPWPAC